MRRADMAGARSLLAVLCLASAFPVRAADPLHDAGPSSEVGRHLNSTVVVCGHVVAVRQTPGNPPGELAFDLGEPGGTADVTVVIVRAHRALFSSVFHRYIDRRQVCVEGEPQRKGGGLPVLNVNAVTGFRFVGVLPPVPEGFGRGVVNVTDLTDAADGVKPHLVRQINPRYTSAAMAAGIQGDVEIDAVVDTDGRISSLLPTKSVDPFLGLDDEAIAAARNWTFSPATLRGQAVPTRVSLQLQFRLTPPPVVIEDRHAPYPVPLQIAAPKLMPEVTTTTNDADGFGLDAGRVGHPGVTPPSARVVPPRYPLDALQQNAQGTIIVDVIVSGDGKVARTRIAQSFPGSVPGTEAEAERCVRAWTFTPGQVNGRPAAVWGQALIDFHIRR